MPTDPHGLLRRTPGEPPGEFPIEPCVCLCRSAARRWQPTGSLDHLCHSGPGPYPSSLCLCCPWLQHLCRRCSDLLLILCPSASSSRPVTLWMLVGSGEYLCSGWVLQSWVAVCVGHDPGPYRHRPLLEPYHRPCCHWHPCLLHPYQDSYEDCSAIVGFGSSKIV